MSLSHDAMIDILRTTLATKGHVAAAGECLAWIMDAKYPKARAKRENIGRELGLIDEAGEQVELERRARLNACETHLFDMTGVTIAAGQIPPRLVCVMCGEWLPTMEASAYARGWAAHGGDPNEIIPGMV